MRNNKVLVTGSSGYVASDLVPLLREKTDVLSVDLSMSDCTDIQINIESPILKSYFRKINHQANHYCKFSGSTI